MPTCMEPAVPERMGRDQHCHVAAAGLDVVLAALLLTLLPEEFLPGLLLREHTETSHP